MIVVNRTATLERLVTWTMVRTTLTAAITKYFGDFQAYDQIDGAPEEKARGITISTARRIMRRIIVTMRTSTAKVTLTMLRT